MNNTSQSAHYKVSARSSFTAPAASSRISAAVACAFRWPGATASATLEHVAPFVDRRLLLDHAHQAGPRSRA
jgi:hypothetical protein